MVVATLCLLAAAATAQSASYQWSNSYNSASFCEAPSTYGTYSISVSQGWQPLGLSDNLKIMFNGSSLLLNCTGICDSIWSPSCSSFVTFLNHISINTTMPLEVYRDVFVGSCSGDPACYTEFVQGVTVSSDVHILSAAKSQALHRLRAEKLEKSSH